MRLTELEGVFAVGRLEPDAPMPPVPDRAVLFSVTRTAEELSVVCPQEDLPVEARSERNFACFEVEGPLDFGLTGVLAGLTAPLAASRVSVFALSTYDTDYLLVRRSDRERAARALGAAGHELRLRRTGEADQPGRDEIRARDQKGSGSP